MLSQCNDYKSTNYINNLKYIQKVKVDELCKNKELLIIYKYDDTEKRLSIAEIINRKLLNGVNCKINIDLKWLRLLMSSFLVKSFFCKLIWLILDINALIIK